MGFTLVNDVTATVNTQSNTGSTSLVVGSGQGAAFASASTANPIRCGSFDGTTGALKVLFDVTARSTDTLTLANRPAEGTTDANILTTDVIAAIATAQVVSDALNAGGGDYFRSGYFYTGNWYQVSGGSAVASSTNLCAFSPFWVPVRRSFDRIGVQVSTASTGGSGGVVRLGLYADGSGGPGSLIVDAGTVSSETTGSKEAVISQTLAPGLYWLAAVAQVAACSWFVTGTTNSSFFVPIGTAAFTTSNTRCLQASVSGALPGTAAPTYNSGTMVAIAMRAT